MTPQEIEHLEQLRAALRATQALIVGAPPGERRRWVRHESTILAYIRKLEAAQS